jgi:oligopeptide/dipeptide ABC transporter ATP-binding protein
MIYQMPDVALNPQHTLLETIGRPVAFYFNRSREEVRARAAELLRQMDLPESFITRKTSELSGGQKQRVSIARALAAEPRLLICDEPVSALDASTRNYVLRLLDELRSSLGLSIVVISHDLSSLAGIADRIVVLYRGRIVEDGPVDEVFTTPRHPYTALLMASAPSVRHDRPFSPRQLRRADTDPPAPDNPDACVFAARCPFAVSACAMQPPLEAISDRRSVACHRHEEWDALARERAGASRS